MRTFKEKFDYNKKRYDSNIHDEFSSGYVFGVSIYQDYPKYDEKGKAEARKLIGDFNELAKGKNGDKMAKGIMCGIRDCANERKRKKK